MKKQSLFLLLSLCLLTACPAEQSTSDQASGNPEPSAAISQAPPPVLTPVESFPAEHIACCWDALSKETPDYPELTLKAYNGDAEALQKLLKLSAKMDILNSYGHGATLADILNHIGDQRVADALTAISGELDVPNKNFDAEPLKYTLRNSIEGGFILNQDESVRKQSLINFPQTSRLLSYTVKTE